MKILDTIKNTKEYSFEISATYNGKPNFRLIAPGQQGGTLKYSREVVKIVKNGKEETDSAKHIAAAESINALDLPNFENEGVIVKNIGTLKVNIIKALNKFKNQCFGQNRHKEVILFINPKDIFDPDTRKLNVDSVDVTGIEAPYLKDENGKPNPFLKVFIHVQVNTTIDLSDQPDFNKESFNQSTKNLLSDYESTGYKRKVVENPNNAGYIIQELFDIEVDDFITSNNYRAVENITDLDLSGLSIEVFTNSYNKLLTDKTIRSMIINPDYLFVRLPNVNKKCVEVNKTMHSYETITNLIATTSYELFNFSLETPEFDDLFLSFEKNSNYFYRVSVVYTLLHEEYLKYLFANNLKYGTEWETESYENAINYAKSRLANTTYEYYEANSEVDELYINDLLIRYSMTTKKLEAAYFDRIAAEKENREYVSQSRQDIKNFETYDKLVKAGIIDKIKEIKESKFDDAQIPQLPGAKGSGWILTKTLSSTEKSFNNELRIEYIGEGGYWEVFKEAFIRNDQNIDFAEWNVEELTSLIRGKFRIQKLSEKEKAKAEEKTEKAESTSEAK